MAAPRNREIGFVSSSFSFRACERAGEAKLRGRVGGQLLKAGPSGPEFRRHVRPCVLLVLVFVNRGVGFKRFWATFWLLSLFLMQF